MQNEKSNFKKEFINRLIRFSIDIIKFIDHVKKDKQIAFSILDQLLRSATSIGANVVEAKASSSRKDYLHYFEIALKSANETKYWLILVKEIYPQVAEEIENFLKELEEISKILGASILTLKGKNSI